MPVSKLIPALRARPFRLFFVLAWLAGLGSAAAEEISVVPSVLEGQAVTLFADVGGGSPPFTYEWRKDNVPIPEATGPILALPSVRVADSGAYTVTVANSLGAIMSTPEVVSVRALHRSRLANLSVAAPASENLIVGFSLAGDDTTPTPLLARAIGPGLTQFGVTGVLADPVLSVFDPAKLIVTSDRSAAGEIVARAAAAAVGAFPLPAGAHDAAVTLSLPPANYTARVTDAHGATGLAMVELYDMTTDSAAASRLVNLSARGIAGTGANALIAGFTVLGESPVRVLVRGVGPSLAQFGVRNPLADPRLALFHDTSQIATNENWADANRAPIAVAATSVGAFALTDDSLDAALLVTVAPGSYTVYLSGAGDSPGTALIEVYEVE